MTTKVFKIMLLFFLYYLQLSRINSHLALYMELYTQISKPEILWKCRPIIVQNGETVWVILAKDLRMMTSNKDLQLFK